MSSVDDYVPRSTDLNAPVQQQVNLPKFTGAFGKIYTIGNAYYERFLTINFAMATDAALGTRQVAIELRNQDNGVLFTVPAVVTQAPSVTQNYLFSSMIPAAIASGTTFSVTPFPGIVFPPGYSLWIDTVNGGPGDSYTSIALYQHQLPSIPESVFNPPKQTHPSIPTIV